MELEGPGGEQSAHPARGTGSQLDFAGAAAVDLGRVDIGDPDAHSPISNVSPSITRTGAEMRAPPLGPLAEPAETGRFLGFQNGA